MLSHPSFGNRSSFQQPLVLSGRLLFTTTAKVARKVLRPSISRAKATAPRHSNSTTTDLLTEVSIDRFHSPLLYFFSLPSPHHRSLHCVAVWCLYGLLEGCIGYSRLSGKLFKSLSASRTRRAAFIPWSITLVAVG